MWIAIKPYMHLSIHWSLQNSILFLLSCVWCYIFRDMHQYSNTSNFGKETHSINHLIKCKIFSTKTAWLDLFFSSLLLLSPFFVIAVKSLSVHPLLHLVLQTRVRGSVTIFSRTSDSRLCFWKRCNVLTFSSDDCQNYV